MLCRYREKEREGVGPRKPSNHPKGLGLYSTEINVLPVNKSSDENVTVYNFDLVEHIAQSSKVHTDKWSVFAKSFHYLALDIFFIFLTIDTFISFL